MLNGKASWTRSLILQVSQKSGLSSASTNKGTLNMLIIFPLADINKEALPVHVNGALLNTTLRAGRATIFTSTNSLLTSVIRSRTKGQCVIISHPHIGNFQYDPFSLILNRVNIVAKHACTGSRQAKLLLQYFESVTE